MPRTRTFALIIVLSLIMILIAIGNFFGGDSEITQLESTEESNEIIVGFSQVGSESDWRTMNTGSVYNAFENSIYDLLFENGQQDQSNQMASLRRFIQKEVDYIILAPVTETGWDTVLMEVKEAGIPVILLDRRIETEDEDLYTCWIGSDFQLEGEKMCSWIESFLESQGISNDSVNIADIQGTIGASAQIGRTKALEDAVDTYGWNLVAQETADFTQTRGKEVVAALLKEHSEINVLYCENDDEALGALEAIEEAGRVAGTDILNGEIMVVSFDGVSRAAMEEVVKGRIACIAECNPEQGTLAEEVISLLESGETPEKEYIVDEGMYSSVSAITSVEVEGESYEVTYLTRTYLENDDRWSSMKSDGAAENENGDTDK